MLPEVNGPAAGAHPQRVVLPGAAHIDLDDGREAGAVVGSARALHGVTYPRSEAAKEGPHPAGDGPRVGHVLGHRGARVHLSVCLRVLRQHKGALEAVSGHGHVQKLGHPLQRVDAAGLVLEVLVAQKQHVLLAQLALDGRVVVGPHLEVAGWARWEGRQVGVVVKR